ncbi:MAG: DUF4402 domain-containing protein [Bacteroidota bacterium]
MKKLALLLVCFLMASGTSFSQTYGSVSPTFTIQANVQSALTVAELTPLEFGQLFQGYAKYVAPTGVSTPTVGGIPTGAATFSIAGAINREVSITFTNHTSISDGSTSIPISYGSDDARAQAGTSATPPTSGWNPTTLGGTVTLDGSGDARVFLGGTATTTTANAAGAYSATGTITVGYTGV